MSIRIRTLALFMFLTLTLTLALLMSITSGEVSKVLRVAHVICGVSLGCFAALHIKLHWRGLFPPRKGPAQEQGNLK